MLFCVINTATRILGSIPGYHTMEWLLIWLFAVSTLVGVAIIWAFVFVAEIQVSCLMSQSLQWGFLRWSSTEGLYSAGRSFTPKAERLGYIDGTYCQLSSLFYNVREYKVGCLIHSDRVEESEGLLRDREETPLLVPSSWRKHKRSGAMWLSGKGKHFPSGLWERRQGM